MPPATVDATDQGIANYFGGPITQPYNPPQEYGVDIGLPADTPVYQLIGGVYQANLSTGYSAVFQTPSGNYEDYLHITPVNLVPGQNVPAGQLIGQVSSLTGSDIYSPNALTGENIGPFDSTGPHLEYGYYSNPTQAEYASGNSAMDPSQALSDNQSSNQSLGQQIASSVGNFVNGIVHAGGSPSAGQNQSPIQQSIANLLPSWLDNLLGVAPSTSSTSSGSSSILGINIPSDLGLRLTVIVVAVALIIFAGFALSHRS